MSRIDFSELALSADQARAARNYFAWSQAVAAEKSGLPPHKIKRFETGNYVPDAPFLVELRAFYERNGYVFDDTAQPGSNAREAGLIFPAGVISADGELDTAPRQGRPVKASIHHMRIALRDEAEMGELLDAIEANEEHAQTLLRHPLETGMFGGISEATKKRHAHVMRLMADNGVMFAKLFGRNLGGVPSPDVISHEKAPTNGAELLHRVQADMHLASAGNADAKDRRKAAPPPDSVLAAFGLN